MRSRTEVLKLVAGMDLVEPGLAWPPESAAGSRRRGAARRRRGVLLRAGRPQVLGFGRLDQVAVGVLAEQGPGQPGEQITQLGVLLWRPVGEQFAQPFAPGREQLLGGLVAKPGQRQRIAVVDAPCERRTARRTTSSPTPTSRGPPGTPEPPGRGPLVPGPGSRSRCRGRAQRLRVLGTIRTGSQSSQRCHTVGPQRPVTGRTAAQPCRPRWRRSRPATPSTISSVMSSSLVKETREQKSCHQRQMSPSYRRRCLTTAGNSGR